MQAIRKRNPFIFQSEDRPNEGEVLDEQGSSPCNEPPLRTDQLTEQEEVVDRLKEQNVSSNKQNRITLQLMLGLSCTLCVVSVLPVPSSFQALPPQIYHIHALRSNDPTLCDLPSIS